MHNSEKDLRMDNGVSGNQNMGNVDASSRSENSCLADKTQMGCCYTNKVPSNLVEEPPIVQEEEKIKIMSMAKHGRIDAKCFSPESTAGNLSGVELRKNGVGISLIDFFTAEQIKEHLRCLNQRNNLVHTEIVGEESIENTSRHGFGENTCQLCAMGEIKLSPPSMYCASCEALIKCNLSYYWTVDEMGTRQCFCTRCFRGSRRNILVKGLSISKEKLCKAKNTEEDDEAWVYCDKCGCWQHQICALYNSKRDLEGKVKYICPYCRLAEMKAMEHVSTPLAIGAQDLPRTLLSVHIKQRFRIVSLQIGYLSYCKRRGFTTCYIWACPPSKGDDYIFHCHPEAQKVPNNLRAWYKKFLQKAKEENVVVECTNFYDCFFIPKGKDNHKITAVRLPYFFGDYWSGAAEDIIRNIEKDSEDKSERKVKKTNKEKIFKSNRT